MKLKFFVSLITLASITAYAENTMQTLYEEALRNNPSVLQASTYLEISQAQRSQLIGATLPDITANYSLNRNVSDSSGRGINFSSSELNQLSATINQPLVNAQTWSRLRQANSLIKQNITQYALAKQTLKLSIATAYAAVLDAEARSTLAKQEVVANHRLVERATSFYAAGNGRKVDALQAEASLKLSESNNITIENEHLSALTRLSTLIGRKILKIAPLSLSKIQYRKQRISDWLEQLRNHNLSITAGRHAIAASASAADSANNQLFPTADLKLTFRQIDYIDDSSPLADNDSTSIELSFKWDIFDFTRYSAIDEAQARSKLAVLQQEELNRNLVNQLQNLLTNIDSGVQQIPALLSLVEAQRQTLESREESLVAGLTELIDVVNSRSDLISAQSRLYRTRLQLWLNVFQLEQLVNAKN